MSVTFDNTSVIPAVHTFTTNDSVVSETNFNQIVNVCWYQMIKENMQSLK